MRGSHIQGGGAPTKVVSSPPIPTHQQIEETSDGVIPSITRFIGSHLPKIRTRHGAGSLTGRFAPAVAAVIIALSVSFASPAIAQTNDVKAPIEQVQSSPLDSAYAELLAADNGDGKLVGRRYGNELENIGPLASAIYDYIDYINPRGSYSFWGENAKGDYSEGGLGLGYSFRPKHMTGNRVLLSNDLESGLASLKSALENGPKDDIATADLRKIVEQASGAANQFQTTTNPFQAQTAQTDTITALSDVHVAVENLLERIVELTGAKELATNNSTAKLTHGELIDALEPGSLERTIAEIALGNESDLFAQEIKTINARAKAFGRTPTDETGLVGDAAMHYILVIGKRAQEGALLSTIQQQL